MIAATRRPMLLALLCLAVAGCSSPKPGDAQAPSATLPASEPNAAADTRAPAQAEAVADEIPPTPSPYDALGPGVRDLLDRPFTGDFDQMVARRLIRAGVTFNRTHYFTDKGVQRGIAYESLKLFEEQVNTRLKTGNLKVNVAFVPLARNQLLPALEAGKVDLVAAQLTITPERLKVVDFSDPTRTDISEVPVTKAGAPALTSVDDLSGRDVFVRRSSSYHESLLALNESLKRQGRPPVNIKDAPEVLEDDDLLEMVNAGLIDLTIVDDYVAEFWQKVFPDLQVHRGAAVRTGGAIGVAIRKNNPKLRQAANIWIKEYGRGKAFGNVVDRRYLQSTQYARSATNEAERKKFQALVELFRKYGKQYDIDFLLMAAQGYQESQLDHSARSRVGAIGVMQVMPATGKELEVGDISQLEPNIHAGVKYIRFMMDQYYKDEPMTPLDKGLMTFAAYNAGPGRVRQLRREAAQRGLDPNVWFGNVERIASERIGRETVQYVSNIYKYYVAYRLAMEQMEQRSRARATAAQPVGR